MKDGITYVVAGATGGIQLIGNNGESFRYMVVKRVNNAYFFVVKDLEGIVQDEFSIKR